MVSLEYYQVIFRVTALGTMQSRKGILVSFFESLVSNRSKIPKDHDLKYSLIGFFGPSVIFYASHLGV